MRHSLILFAAFSLIASIGCILPEDDGFGGRHDAELPRVVFDVESNPPDCRNADEIDRSFDRVSCTWECAHFKGTEGRRVEITFEPKGDYVDKEIRTWHVAKEEVDDAYSWECPDWYDEDAY